jgi:glycosyltransferase involved in cell wall biosynthesis
MSKRRKRTRYDVAFYVPRIGPLLSSEAVSPTGGAETQILLLAHALAARGIKVRLVVFELPGIALAESVGNVTVSVRPPYRAHEPFGRLREAASIGRAIARADADVVVTRGATPEVGLAALFAKLSGRRFVYSSANVSDFRETETDARGQGERVRSTPANVSSEFDFSQFPRSRLEWGLFRLAIRLADQVVVQTEEQVRLCEERFGRLPALIRSIAEPAPRRVRQPEALLWIARLVSYKRPLEYVELARALPEAQFWMVAPPENVPDRDLIEAVDRAAATVPNLEVLAPRPRRELMELVDRAVAVVNTADFEGMPNIFLEGWSRGVPALALTHDPDGVIERHSLGAFAHGSGEILIELARRMWEGRNNQADVAARCRNYVLEHHSPEGVSARWQDALGIVPATKLDGSHSGN